MNAFADPRSPAPELPRITLRINGEPRQTAAGATVAALLAELELDPRAVAVELDGAIVPRDERAVTALRDGARLEIVRFVQGG